MFAKRLSALVLAGSLAFPVATLAAAPEIPMPKSYHTLTVTTGGGAGLVVAMVMQEISGKIAFCGATWPVDQRREVLARRQSVMREVKVVLQGKDIPAEFSVFPAYNAAEEATKARCAVTNKAWNGPYKNEDLTMTLRRSKVRD